MGRRMGKYVAVDIKVTLARMTRMMAYGVLRRELKVLPAPRILPEQWKKGPMMIRDSTTAVMAPRACRPDNPLHAPINARHTQFGNAKPCISYHLLTTTRPPGPPRLPLPCSSTRQGRAAGKAQPCTRAICTSCAACLILRWNEIPFFAGGVVGVGARRRRAG